MSKTCYLSLICGTLGAGKTTLLTRLFTQKPDSENWAVIVNEFGALGIDGAILQKHTSIEVKEIPGGCVCCSALPELQNTLQELLDSKRYQRIFIEPTGLSEVDTLVDMIRRFTLQTDTSNIQLDNVICLMASDEIKADTWQQNLSWQNLANMADILIFNKIDLCSSQQRKQLQQLAEKIYPPKQQLLFTEQARVPLDMMNNQYTPNTQWLLITQQPFKASPMLRRPHQLNTNNIDIQMPQHPLLLDCQMQSANKTISIGWRFDQNAVFDWQMLQTVFEQFSDDTADKNLLRMKGVFRVGRPWMLFQWRNQQLSREIIAYRNDSRIEVLIDECTENAARQLAIQLYKNLLNCLKPA
ncbi:Cobalamin biosynthesis protein CobW [uncultured Thiomicrorhabdus sp.]